MFSFQTKGTAPKSIVSKIKKKKEGFCDQALRKGAVFYLYHKSGLFYGLTIK